MKIIYATGKETEIETTTEAGKILEAIPDYRWFWWKHSINIPFEVLGVPEIEDNRELCIDVKNSMGRQPDEINDYRNYKVDVKEKKLTLDDVVVDFNNS